MSGLLIAGIIFTVCCEPYLDSEYGADFVNDSPVRLMDLTLHGHREVIEQEACLLALFLLLGLISMHHSLAVQLISLRCPVLALMCRRTQVLIFSRLHRPEDMSTAM